MDTEGGLSKEVQNTEITKSSDVELSKSIANTSSSTELATLAMQASQKP